MRCSSLVLLLSLSLPAALAAQSRMTGADLHGHVTDTSAAMLPGVSVKATNVDTQVTHTAQTDGRGRYHLPALAPGRYEVSAALDRFATQIVKPVVVQLGQSVELDFRLELASGQEEITVAVDAPLIDAGRSSVASTVSAQQIASLPLSGRNFIGLTVITPGVTTDRTPQQGASATSGLSFGGQRARSNNIMVDGFDHNDAVVGSVRSVFSQDAVREFQVLTNSYSAEFGRASGGVVNMVTKSGTNELHGNAYAYFRNESLNAKSHFERFDVFGGPIAVEKAPFRQYQWGGTLGGPIQRDRTHFFASFERTDVQASNVVNIDPSAATVLRSAGFPVELGHVRYDYEATDALLKVDHQWKPNHNLVLRFNYSDNLNENIEPFGGTVARSRGAVQNRDDWFLSASQTDVLAPRWLNELRVQFSRQDQTIDSLDPVCDGPCDTDEEGGPTVEVVGVAAAGRQRFTPNPRRSNRIQVLDSVTFFSGAHSFKAGLDFSYTNYESSCLPLHFGGRYVFAPLPAVPALGIPAPISAVQALALGLPAAYVQGYGNPCRAFTYNETAAFLQDEWRVSRKLTLQAGVRYQRQFWPDQRYDVSSLAGSRVTYSYPTDRNDIAPRLGLAFDPAGNGRLSLRASYGLFYDAQLTAILPVTDIVDGSADGLRTLVLRFPSSIPAWRAPGHRLSEAQATAMLGGSYPSLALVPDPRLKTPFAHQASVGVDRAIGSRYALSASFIYIRGKNAAGSVDYNPIVPALGAGRRPNDVAGRAGTSAPVVQYTSFGETWYRGLTVSFSRRAADKLQFLLSYTFSKAEDSSTDFQSNFIPQDNGVGRNPADLLGLPLGFDPRAERGPATHDQRHRFVASGSYQLPWSLQVAGILTAGSGRPYTPLAGFDWNGDGDGGAFPTDRARRNPADPASSVGRNSMTMDSQIVLDMRLSKKITMGRGHLELVAEAFNLLNRTNFSEINPIFGPGAFPGAPQTDAAGRVTYGRYEQALAPRQVQLAVRLGF